MLLLLSGQQQRQQHGRALVAAQQQQAAAGQLPQQAEQGQPARQQAAEQQQQGLLAQCLGSQASLAPCSVSAANIPGPSFSCWCVLVVAALACAGAANCFSTDLKPQHTSPSLNSSCLTAWCVLHNSHT